MSLFGFVDKLIGTDFSGDKAKKAIDKATGAATSANAQATETMKEYSTKASELFKQYVDQGMSEYEAAQKAASDALREGYTKAEQTYQTGSDAAVNRLEQGYQTGQQTYMDMFNQAQQARAPYEDAGRSMLGVLPQLQGALGLPGGAAYDVTASPMYQWQLGQMDEQLANQLAAMGVGNDTVGAYIRSKGVQQLGAQERERQIANMQQMLGQGINVASSLGVPQMQAAGDLSGMNVGAGVNAANLMAQNTGGLASMQAQAGAGQADLLNQAAVNRANMLAQLGQNLGQVQLGLGGNVAQGQIATGQNIMNAGISKAQIPNPMNQLINTGLQLYGMGAFTPAKTAAAAAPAGGGSVGGFSFNNMPRLYGLTR
jgi:hypothetical protein